jgi:hypothetical protein
MCQRHRWADWLTPLLVAASMAASGTASEIIGLCYRDGSDGTVLEEVFKTEGVAYVRLRDLGRLEQRELKGLILAEGFDSSAGEVERFLGRGGTVLCLRPAGRLAEALGLKEIGVQTDGYLVVDGKGGAADSCQGRFQLFGQTKRFKGGENLARLNPNDSHRRDEGRQTRGYRGHQAAHPR